MKHVAALGLALALVGCAIRYDHNGVSRAGVFLWGLGDPPGVKWNLDWPRREDSVLPPQEHHEALPRFEPARAPASPETRPNGTASERSSVTFDDNRDRASRRAPESAPAPVVPRAGDRGDDDARRWR